jgi:glycyl-tRNA synthetase beta chain
MAELRDFLLEIGSEEMPSAPLEKAIKQLYKLAEQNFKQAGLSHGEIKVESTPRRLALVVKDVPLATEEVHQVLRGPAAAIAFDADGNPTKAAAGFARGKGIDPSDLVVREDGGKEYVFAEIVEPSRPATEILASISEAIIPAIDWPRSQRWGSEHARYVRPVRWLVCMLGDQPIDISYADVKSGTTTRGHRVLGAGEHNIPDVDAYESVLEAAHVLLQDARVAKIREGIAGLEQAEGVVVDTPARIFDEVVNLCEWPTVLVGHFDEEFLDVPHEIICESMLNHQRYFPVYKDGELTNAFVVVSNGDPQYDASIVDGNERVVRARLDDAKFFFEEDLKNTLESYLDRLEEVVFQEKLGTMRQKAARMEAIAPYVAELAGEDAETVKLAARAARLAKADLVTQAVVEFTSQQGTMGGYYAAAAGEDDIVAQAISEQYRPRFAGDELPATVVGKCVAISDKLDTICGMFAIDEPPTGSSDPFAQRRSAIGVINMLLVLVDVDLPSLIDASLDTYAEQGLEFDKAAVRAKVVEFFQGRLATMAKDSGVSPDTISAVQATGVVNPDDFMRRVHALEAARADQKELFEDLAIAYARAVNLADPTLGTDVDEALLGDAENALLAACVSGQAAVDDALASKAYDTALAELAKLREPIDAFFEDVMVMDKDARLRENRLRLLNRFSNVFSGVANFSMLERA